VKSDSTTAHLTPCPLYGSKLVQIESQFKTSGHTQFLLYFENQSVH